MFSKLGLEGRVDAAKIGREFFRKADCERVPGFEFALQLREMNLRNRFFVESLTRRRRVASEESGVTLIEGGDLESRQFLDP